MATITTGGKIVAEASENAQAFRLRTGPWPVTYALSLLFVVLATIVALLAGRFVAGPTLSLIYVIPVVLAATLFGWGPSLLAIVLGVAAFDFFFTVPYYSFTMSDPSEVWAALLLLVVASIVTYLSAESRRQALMVSEAAAQSEALYALAHAVLQSHDEREVFQGAANALSSIFRAPSAVFTKSEGELKLSASAGGAQPASVDVEAARGALDLSFHSRGETYPFDQTSFDFWPVSTNDGRTCVLGIDFAHSTRERPDSPEKLVEVVAGYVAAALATRTIDTA